MSKQNDIEWLKDQLQLGNITAEKANVEMVRMERVKIINGSIPSHVRKALNTAVKVGELCHKQKEGRKPEVYYHPNFEHLADEKRNQSEKKVLKSLAGVVARPIL